MFIGYTPNKRGYKCYNPQKKIKKIKIKIVSLNVLFVESRPYFGPNCLQGESENNEAQFWETTIPLPNIILPVPVLNSSTSNSQEIGSHNNEKEGKTSLPLPNFNDSQTRGEPLR